jgi:hypothetical protein
MRPSAPSVGTCGLKLLVSDVTVAGVASAATALQQRCNISTANCVGRDCRRCCEPFVTLTFNVDCSAVAAVAVGMQLARALLQLLHPFESSLSRPPFADLFLRVEVGYALGGARVTGACVCVCVCVCVCARAHIYICR